MRLKDLLFGKKVPETRRGRPEGRIEILQTLHRAEDTRGAYFSFEKKLSLLELVRCGRRHYVRRIQYSCCAGANTRPESFLSEEYYAISNIRGISDNNWKERTSAKPDYRFECFGNDVLY